MSDSRIQFDRWAGSYADRMKTMRSSAVRDLFAAASRSDIISLSGGMPDISALPLDQVAEAAKNVILDEGLTALQYGGTNGRIQTRELVCEMVKDMDIDAQPENVIITTGAQQALDLIPKTFVNPGDVILTEGPTYLGALQAFSAYQPDVHCIPMDDEGIRIDLLEEELKRLGKGGAKFLYTIPNFQNPTGVTMSLERRKRLIELMDKYNIPIVEDNPYGRLRYAGEEVPTLRSMSDDVIYLGTVSKIFAPGLRLGCIIAPEGIISKINLIKQGTDLCGSALCQVMVEHYFHDTQWRETLKKSIAVYTRRRQAILDALEELMPPEVTWTKPEGGLFIWVTVPKCIDTDELLNLALERGITFAPGSSFYPDGRGHDSMRMAFCFEEPEQLHEAIRRLAEVINERLELYRAFVKAGVLEE
jgi:2-aminoadipate transaminase